MYVKTTSSYLHFTTFMFTYALILYLTHLTVTCVSSLDLYIYCSKSHTQIVVKLLLRTPVVCLGVGEGLYRLLCMTKHHYVTSPSVV